MQDLISVIIPAYNVQSRIKFTLESVIAQDYENIEIIIVDDASNDETGIKAREILEGSSRKFKFITHEENRGECGSRNTGLEHAQGKYICFIDGDDLIRENYVSRLQEIIAQTECDIVFCGLLDRFTDGRADRDVNYSCKEAFTSSGEFFILKKLMPPVVCCLYNAEFLRKNNLLFHEVCSAGGDVEFITKAMCVAEKVTFTNECLYIYIHHSEMGSVRDNDTKAKKLIRYEHNTQAQIRTADFLITNAKMKRIIFYAREILKPQNLIRQLTIYAMKNDLTSYNLLRQDKESIKVLREALSLNVFLKNPEVSLKALLILCFPKIYYVMREKL